jgi:hypothetical protein
VRRAALILFAIVAGFWCAEGLIFHTSVYWSIIRPDSSTGLLESLLDNEVRRPRDAHPQILGIGDSRMGALKPRIANKFTPQTGLTFATIAAAGTTPRCWYYMLRDADPGANHYAAIVIALESYDDTETWEDHADRESDLHYLIARLRWSDLQEFSGSYHNPQLQREAFRGILLKGLIFKRDFEDFLLHPAARIAYARQSRRDSHTWFNDFVDTSDSLKDVHVDFNARTVTVPPGSPANRAQELRMRLLDPSPPDTGRESAYMHYWLGRIYDLYRGSKTRLVFLRLPRGGFVRPDPPPLNPHSSARDLAARPEVRLIPEHFYDALERPELFHDEVHLNEPGATEFSRMLAFEMRDLLAGS